MLPLLFFTGKTEETGIALDYKAQEEAMRGLYGLEGAEKVRQAEADMQVAFEQACQEVKECPVWPCLPLNM